MNKSIKDLVGYITNSIDILVSIKLNEELEKYKLDNDTGSEVAEYEKLLQKLERNIREHISIEHQLKIQCEKYVEKLEILDTTLRDGAQSARISFSQADKIRIIGLLDELGAGTDPDEGAALAVCITERIRKGGAKAIITTHYSKLKEYSYSTKGVENASMDFNPETYEPTFHLIIGIPGTSNALQIAARLGLDPDIIREAKGVVGADRVNFDEVLMSADQARRAAEAEKEEQKVY